MKRCGEPLKRGQMFACQQPPLAVRFKNSVIAISFVQWKCTSVSVTPQWYLLAKFNSSDDMGKTIFGFFRQLSVDCCLKHFVHLWICRLLSAQSYRTWLHIIYDSDSFGDYCNVPLPFYNCSVVPKLVSWEILRYDWQSEEQTQRTICKKLHCKYHCTLTM